MNRIFRNTAAVIVLTLFTGLAVFTAIQLGDRLFGTSDASAQSASTQSSSSSSTATDTEESDSSGNGYDSGSSSGSNGYGQSSGSESQGSSEGELTCPATGCTASSCHATQ